MDLLKDVQQSDVVSRYPRECDVPPTRPADRLGRAFTLRPRFRSSLDIPCQHPRGFGIIGEWHYVADTPTQRNSIRCPSTSLINLGWNKPTQKSYSVPQECKMFCQSKTCSSIYRRTGKTKQKMRIAHNRKTRGNKQKTKNACCQLFFAWKLSFQGLYKLCILPTTENK